MKAVGPKILGRKNGVQPSTSRLATNVPTFKLTFDSSAGTRSTEHYAPVAAAAPQLPPQPDNSASDNFTPDNLMLENGTCLPFPDGTPEDVLPAYETTVPCDEEGPKTRQTVSHMDELKAQESVFLRNLLSLHHHSQLLSPCVCGLEFHLRKVACSDCLQAELLCPQCWLNKHRTMPTHWALVWKPKERFFEKTDFCRVLENAVVALGHYVDSNGIHATAISFCRCQTADGSRTAEFEQLLQAGIFPGSVKEPKTGYTLGLLGYYHQERSQGKGSAYNFVHVLQRMADPYFADTVPDIYKNFLAITRFHGHLDIVMRRGHAHGVDVPLAGKQSRPYPNRPIGYLGLQCAACPERGVNMPLVVNVPKYLRHLISQHLTLDGNFKANLFYKRDDGSDKALTDGRMYFPRQTEFEEIARSYVINKEDTEVPCDSHIGSVRHQGLPKYGNTAVSGVIACACDHTVAGSLVDMLKGEAFALGTYAQREFLSHYHSPAHTQECRSPITFSYDSWCSFVINLLTRALELFPEETWLHELLAAVEGQIPADHIMDHGPFCRALWQAIYFNCRAHFYGESAELLWAFLNPLGSSTRQMTGGARHDIINFVIDAWNTLKVLRQARLLADERLEALHLFELHMAVVEDLSKQHATEVVTLVSHVAGRKEVWQSASAELLTIDNVLASMVAEEREKMARQDAHSTKTSVAHWIHDGMGIERQQNLVIALLKNHREHALQETWATITKLRDGLNTNLKKFREHQRSIYPHLKLSALDMDEPELTAIQLPSYRMKHGHQPTNDKELELVRVEVKLRCTEAENGILAVRAASLALSAVKKAREQDYRGQVGMTRSQRNIQKAELTKTYEIAMYNRARNALIRLGHMAKEAVEPYPPLTYRDTRRKDTHLHRARGDSKLFDGAAWYLQSGMTVSSAVAEKTLPPVGGRDELLTGTQTLKRKGNTQSARQAKRFKDSKDSAPKNVTVAVESSGSEPEGSDMEASPSKRKPTKREKKAKTKKSSGWVWLDRVTSGQKVGEGKLAEYKAESDRVQWFRAEAEMYRWLEQYERKHAELMRVIERYRRDSEVWVGLADREEQRNTCVNGAVTYARTQAVMYARLQRNAEKIFQTADGAHVDWVTAKTFEELVTKVDGWRDEVFKWMDAMDIHRAYKDFTPRTFAEFLASEDTEGET
ncbi:hypothetical protein B0H12DRAFT_1245628 [Mycena haematopus]|nr:hypothetical protein B0H12DRAFT_1245628 [Mycena haematopus]